MEFSKVAQLTVKGKSVRGMSKNGKAFWEKHHLPLAYQEVAYLQSDANSYIDTKVPDSDPTMAYDVTFQYVSSTGTYKYVLGCWSKDSDANTVLFMNGTDHLGGWVCKAYSSGAMTDYKITPSDIIHVISDSDKTVINETEFTQFAEGTERAGANLFLFRRNGTDGSAMQTTSAILRIMQCKLYSEGIPIRNYIPCYRKSDNTPGLFDTVTKVFYTNAGSGTFTVGPAV